MSGIVIESTDETRIELDSGSDAQRLVVLSVHYDPREETADDPAGFQVIALDRADVDALIAGLRALMPGAGS